MKFDGQLTLKIDEVIIHSKASQTTKEDNRTKESNELITPKTLYASLFYNIGLLKQVQIRQISYKKNQYRILYDKETLILHHKTLKLAAKSLHADDDNIMLATVIEQKLDDNLTLSAQGTININLKKNYALFEGDARLDNFKLNMTAKFSESENYLEVFQDKFSSYANTQSLHKYIKTNPWLRKNLKCDTYKIKKAKIFLDRHFNLIKDHSILNLHCKDFEITFHPTLAPLALEDIEIDIKGKHLSVQKKSNINYTKTLYSEIDFEINDIYANPTMVLKVRSDDFFLHKDNRQLLEAYDITLPIEQISGQNVINVVLKYMIKQEKANIQARLTSQNTKVIAFDYPITFNNLDLSIQDEVIAVHSIDIDSNLGSVSNRGSLIFDSNSGTLKGNVSIDAIRVISNQDNLEPLKTSIAINSNDATIRLRELETTISYENAITAIFNDLSKWKIEGLFSPIWDGQAVLMHNEGKTRIRATVNNLDTPFLIKNIPISTLSVNILHQGKGTRVYNEDIDISVDANSLRGNIRNIDINLSKLDNNESSTIDLQTNVKFENSNIYYEDFYFTLEQSSLVGNPTNTLTFLGSHKEGTVKAEIEQKNIKLLATNLSDEFLNTAIEKKIFQDGKYNFTLSSNPKNVDYYYGTFEIQNATIKNMAMANNVLSTLNLSLKGYNAQGIHVKKGKIQYNIIDNKLLLNPISIASNAVNIKGKGVYNLDNEHLNAYIQASIFKGVSNAIEQLPIFNYIILGKNKDVNINMTASGSLDNPKITLTKNQDIVNQPFNILLRTLSLPQNLIKSLIQ